jgi:hypothetical protein
MCKQIVGNILILINIENFYSDGPDPKTQNYISAFQNWGKQWNLRSWK